MSRYEKILIENDHIEVKDFVELPEGYAGFIQMELCL